jgi:flagellin-specific chaperone FliS
MGSYQEHVLESASAVDLVVALYDGILRFLHSAMRLSSAAIRTGDGPR